MKTRILLFGILILSISKGASQVITLQDNRTAMQLVNGFLGTGVNITSASLTCNNLANGTFTNTNTNPLSLTLDAGAVLSTGRVKTTPKASGGFFIGIDSSRFSSADTFWGSTTPDPQITTIAPAGAFQRDVCKLEFVFIPEGDSMYIDYVFASEEYPDFNCTQYGDVFGIFVKPTSSSTYNNYATLPGTSIPVYVNSINNGTAAGGGNFSLYCSSLGAGIPNTALYVDNQIANHVVYDGMTKILKARIPVTPNVAHNAKIAISDILDGKYDSGVFLKGNSMISYPLLKIINKKSTNHINTNPLFIIEGCDSGIITFQRSPNNAPLNINVTFGGNATASDYIAQTNFSIPATVTNYNYPIKALLDGLTELNDSVVLNFSAPTIGFSESVTYHIRDFARGINVFNNTNDTTVCHGKNVPLTFTSSDPSYSLTWNPPTNLSCTNCTNPTYIASNGNVFSNAIVNLNISTPGCTSVDSPVTIHIQPNPDISFATSTSYNCKNDSLVLTPIITPNSNLYTYTWAANPTLSSTTVSNPTAKPNSTQTYYVTVTTSAGCRDTASQTILLSDIRAEIDSMRTSSASCGATNGSISLYNTPSAPYLPTYVYSINGGTSYTLSNIFSNLAPGPYDISIRNGQNCKFDTTLTVANGANPPIFTTSQVNTTCGQNNGSAKLNTKSGFGPFTYQWKLGSTVISTDTFINNKAPGLYTFIVTDANGCSTTQLISIMNSSSLTTVYNTVHQSCSKPNGSIIVFPTGGVFPYTYNWAISPNPGNVNSISNLVAGKYKLTITDNAGCILVDSVFLVNSLPPSITMTSTVAACNTSNGTATTTIVSGGNPNYTYEWSNGVVTSPIANTNHTISTLSPGKYIVTVTDSKGCISKDSISIIGTNKPSISLIGTNINCSSNNGTISTTATGGQPGYTYNWNDGSLAKNRTNLAPSIYTITVTDANGCTASQSVNIGINSNPTLSLTKSDATCKLSNGNVVTQLAGARPPVIYQWSNGSNANFINNLSAGTYKVTITDSFGCQKIDSAKIDSIIPLDFNYSKINTSCGNINGSIAITGLSGIPPYYKMWSDGDTNLSRNNLPAGTYSLYVQDSNQCSKTITLNIAPSDPLILNALIQHAVCNKLVGDINTSIISGVAPFTYLWSNGETTSSITNKVPGTYTLTAHDSFNCPFSYTGTILRKATPTYTSNIVNPICNQPNGSIILNNIVGNPPIEYYWSNISGVSINPSNLGLDTGTYTLFVSDVNGCMVYDTFHLTSNYNPEISFRYLRPNCADSNGYIKAVIKAGNPTYTYKWYKNGAVISTQDSIFGLKHDNFIFQVTDSKGCTNFSSFNLKNITNLTAKLYDTATRCDTLTGRASAVGDSGTAPYKYQWIINNKIDSNQYVDSLAVGHYKVRIIDSNKCLFDTFLNIDYDHHPTIVLDSLVKTTCNLNNGLIKFSLKEVVEPIKIQWDYVLDSTYLKSGLAPKTYNISIEDSFKCIGNSSFEVLSIPILNVISTPENAHCGLNNGKITLTVDNVPSLKSYHWSNGDTTNIRTSLAAGKYYYTVTDINNCLIIDSPAIINTGFPNAKFNLQHEQCNKQDGAIDLEILTPYAISSYSWSSGQTYDDISLLAANKYKVTITDEFGCVKIDSAVINAIPGPSINFNVHHSLCMNGKGSIKATVTNASGGLNYTWFNFNNSDSVSNLNQGNYKLTVVDGRNCMKVDSANVKFYSKPTILATAFKDNCSSGDGAIFSNTSLGTTPYKFLWNTGDTTKDLVNIFGGQYKVIITDSVGCKDTAQANVLSTPKPLIAVDKIDANCNLNNGYAKATISSGKTPYIYNWDNFVNLDSITGLDTGFHIFTVIDSNLCVNRDTIKIDRISFPNINFNITNDNCTYSKGNINATIVGGKAPFTYLWNNGLGTNNNINNLSAGSYTLNIVDSLGCSVSSTALVSDTAGPVVSINVIQASCGLNNGSINTTVSSIYTPLQFYYNNLLRNKDTTGLNGGSFILKTIDTRGCIHEVTAELDTVYPLSITKSIENATCGLNNGTIKINSMGGTPPYSYIWNSSTNTTDSLDNLSAGTYAFTLSDSKGCLLSDTVTIIQKGIPSIVFDTLIPSKCNLANGYITTTVTGGVAPYNYSWSSGNSTNGRVLNALANTYTLTISDASNCFITNTATLINKGITAINMIVTEPKCNGNNGKINTTTSNAVLPITYLWSNGSSTDSLSNLSPATYSVTVTDSLNCSVTNSKVLTNQRSPEITLSSINASCNINNGKVLSLINYGTPPFNFIWSNGLSSANITDLDSGNYSVSITDALGCKDTAKNYVARIAMLKVTNTMTKSVCGEANGSITTSVSGGTPIYQYLWNNGESTANISNKLPGNYTLSVTDLDFCQVIVPISILDFTKTKNYTYNYRCSVWKK